MKKRVYDVSFKEMAVSLSEAKGSIKAAADGLGIDPARISQRKHQYKGGVNRDSLPVGSREEQKEIRRLHKELKEAQQEQDIIRKTVSIFSRGDGRYSGDL